MHGATLRQAQAQRRAIERVTGIEVQPLLVYSRAWVDRPLATRKGVRVLPARMLAGYLDRRKPALAREQVARARAQVTQALREHRARKGRRRPAAAPPDRVSQPGRMGACPTRREPGWWAR